MTLRGIGKNGLKADYTDCKAVDVGSIPILASGLSPGGGIGRRYGLKIR